MNEAFHESKTLDKQKINKLIAKNNHPAILHFLIMYSLFLGAAIGVFFSWNSSSWLFIGFSQFFFGILVCSLFACQHETVHNTAFKSIRLNQLAAFLTGMSYLYAPTMFQELHFTHHRHTHEPGLDPEISLGGKAIPSIISNLPFYLTWLSGLPLFMFKLGMLIWGALGMPEIVRKNVYPFVQPTVRIKLMFESWLILSLHTSFILLAIYGYTGFYGIYIGLLVGHCLLASYTAMEHNGLPHEGSILEKTRSIKANPFVKFLMWNMPYHAEHHAYPAVPFHALPDLHEIMHNELLHKDQNHPAFHLSIFKKTTIGDKN